MCLFECLKGILDASVLNYDLFSPNSSPLGSHHSKQHKTKSNHLIYSPRCGQSELLTKLDHTSSAQTLPRPPHCSQVCPRSGHGPQGPAQCGSRPLRASGSGGSLTGSGPHSTRIPTEAGCGAPGAGPGLCSAFPGATAGSGWSRAARSSCRLVAPG